MTRKGFDLAILGGGPGGYTAAIRAAQLGMSVGLVEKKYLGGTCLNIGCIPTKALIHSARLYEDARQARTFGIKATDVVFDWPSIQKYKNRCVIKLRKGVESLMKKNFIEVISDHGVLKDPETIDADGNEVKAKHIILATGSYARSLPSLPIDGERVITSDHALELEELPASILIVGAGAIGCEFGYFMSAFGVDVTIVEFLEHALPMEDEDISVEFEGVLKRRKIKLHTNCSVESVEMTDTGVRSTVKPRDGESEFTIETEKVLISVGRGAATSDCGFENVGIPMEKGFIQVDDMLKTGVASIRAIGDAIGGLMLAHEASAEGILAAEDIARLDRKPITYENIPRATYTRPEIGSVGLSEARARQKYGDSIRIGKVPFAAVGKAVVMGESGGFAKLIASGKDGKLVGASVIGPNAVDLIAVAATAVTMGATAEEFAHVVQAHPTVCEIWHETAHALIDGPINA